jgi:hypothetical protein
MGQLRAGLSSSLAPRVPLAQPEVLMSFQSDSRRCYHRHRTKSGISMKRIIIALVAVKFAMLGSAGVSAGFYSGKGVVANCNSEANYDNGWCAGYLGSWADGDIDMVRRKACIPPDTSIGTLKKVLMDYAEANPQDVEAMSGGELLQRAFSRKWPTASTDDTVSEIYRKTC